MIYYIQTINLFLAMGGLALFAVTILLFIDYYWNKSRYYQCWFAPYSWFLVVGMTLFGVLLTLVYSEYFGFVPCSLCWLQRVALYPQCMVAIVAWRVKDATFFPLYGIALSLFGTCVAIYQYIYQLLPKELLTAGVMPCLADGTADCADKIMNVFGFVTFPFLSAVTFLFLIVIYLNMRRMHRD
jgi:disulfide bond formation protein DsbB